MNEATRNIFESTQKWAQEKIDETFENPLMRHYLKKGLNNYIARHTERIDRIGDMIELFLADENGDISTDTMIDDICSVWNQTNAREFDLGAFILTLDKGEAVLSVKDNPWLDFLLGNIKHVKITNEDLTGLKRII